MSIAALKRRLARLEAAQPGEALTIAVIYVDEAGHEVGRADPVPVWPNQPVDYRKGIIEGDLCHKSP